MSRRAPHAVAVFCVLGVLAGCTSDASKVVSAPPGSPSRPPSTSPRPTPPTPSATTRPAPTPPPPAVNPLSGGRPVGGPVIAVKIDDTAAGRPQLNIQKADIVYIEEAEAGLSRLVAIFDSNKPTVGYVRSIRPSDPELLLQYGTIALAASGGASNPLGILDRSGLRPWLMDRGAAFYRRDYSRASDYINVQLDLAAVSKQLKTPAARSIGFTWNAARAGLGRRPSGRSLTTAVGTTPVRFDYDAKRKRYVRVIDGAPQRAVGGAVVSTPNVIVQSCRVTAYPADTDVNNNPSQFTHTVGRGQVTVLRNGRRISGTWSRASKRAGTVLKDRSGRVIPLAPGGAWVVLVRTGTNVSTR